MNPKRAWLVVALTLLVAGLSLGVASAGDGSSNEEPKYYVDGARAAPNADAQTNEGCVPWSSAQADVYVCGPLPAGWEPPAPPHYDASLCQSAQAILTAQRASLLDNWGFVPEVDASTCVVMGHVNGYDWYVLFTLANGDEARPYGHALVAIDVDEGLKPLVSLS
jgi:hypothetical protein